MEQQGKCVVAIYECVIGLNWPNYLLDGPPDEGGEIMTFDLPAEAIAYLKETPETQEQREVVERGLSEGWIAVKQPGDVHWPEGIEVEEADRE